MTVKDRVGRTRYIAFRIDGTTLSRGALSAALPPFAKLTRFDGTHGIVRTNHRDRDALVQVLKDLRMVSGTDVRVETLVTSGTIRQAALALPKESAASKRTPAPRG